MTRLEQAKLLLDFYFAPWGAAKGAVWEDVSGDREFSDEVVTNWLNLIMSGISELNEEQIKLMKIVVEP